MAVSIAAGVLMATVVSLVIVPAAYLVLDDLRRLFLDSRSPVERGAESPVEGAVVP
jgi:hypothetical protein